MSSTDIRVKITSGGSRRGLGRTVQLVVRGVRRSIRLEEPEQSLGHTGFCGSQRGDSVSGARHAAGCVRESRMCSHVVGTNEQRRLVH